MKLEQRAAPHRAAPARSGRLISPRAALVAGGVVVLALAALVTAGLLRGGGGTGSGATGSATAGSQGASAPAALVAQVAHTPAHVDAAAGGGDKASYSPSTVAGGALRRVGGKPLVFYLGAEFCPYCAAERWALVNALGRFGTFHGLRLTHSAADDVFPSTPTFSFDGARYTSPYLTLQTVEYASNERQGSGYAPLQTPSAPQQSLFSRFDAPPFVAERGAIPFVYLGGRYVSQGSQVQPGLLQGKTPSQVARAIRQPGSPISTSVVGSANRLTAALCSLTGGKPASACSLPAVRALAG